MQEQSRKKVTIGRLYKMKARKERIAALGVYDSPMAAWADAVGFDMFVIGNSGPMSLFGHRNSTTVKADELLFMTQAVSRVTRYALIVATLPYMSYAISKEEAVRSAARLVSEGGAECVQCHGNTYTSNYIRAITGAGIPVLAHLGLQSVKKVEQSGFGVKGRTAADAKRIVDDALALADAGVFAFIVEMIPTEVTAHLRDHMGIPIISLGSGSDADGVYLVSADMTGYSVARRPKNAGQFVDVRPVIEEALRTYRDQARSGTYPTKEQAHRMGSEEFAKFKELLNMTGN
jgi:3-methyl-2-oxobutanoate hydroxymethyltransferase